MWNFVRAGLVLLAMMLAGGSIVLGDTEFEKTKRLAEQGDTKEQFNLGDMYFSGNGVPQDHAEAIKWFRLAAEQGDAKAQFALGTMYLDDDLVPQDHAEATKWFRMSAEQGFALGQLSLGLMYVAGEGIPHNRVLAHMWLNLAAASGPEREYASIQRDKIARMMTSAEIAEAQKLAREWFAKNN